MLAGYLKKNKPSQVPITNIKRSLTVTAKIVPLKLIQFLSLIPLTFQKPNWLIVPSAYSDYFNMMLLARVDDYLQMSYFPYDYFSEAHSGVAVSLR